jgi:predicted Fe-Mo cluster-binding NifX family protein
MRVAISADDNRGLDSVVSPHFGRCAYYVLVDLDGREVQQVDAVENPYYGHHQPGQVPGFIERQGADVMLAGGMGRRAIALFQQCGIEPVTGAAGSVRHALEQYLGGALQGAAPCRESLAHGHEEAVGESEYEEDEAGRLREEIEMLRRQLNEAMGRLDRLANDKGNRSP